MSGHRATRFVARLRPGMAGRAPSATVAKFQWHVLGACSAVQYANEFEQLRTSFTGGTRPRTDIPRGFRIDENLHPDSKTPVVIQKPRWNPNVGETAQLVGNWRTAG